MARTTITLELWYTGWSIRYQSHRATKRTARDLCATSCQAVLHTWNAIPSEVRAIVDEHSFKRCMLNLVKSYFNDNYKADDQCTSYIVCNNH